MQFATDKRICGRCATGSLKVSFSNSANVGIDWIATRPLLSHMPHRNPVTFRYPGLGRSLGSPLGQERVIQGARPALEARADGQVTASQVESTSAVARYLKLLDSTPRRGQAAY